MLHPVLLSPRIQNLDCKHSKGMTGLVLSVLVMTYWLDPAAVASYYTTFHVFYMWFLYSFFDFDEWLRVVPVSCFSSKCSFPKKPKLYKLLESIRYIALPPR